MTCVSETEIEWLHLFDGCVSSPLRRSVQVMSKFPTTAISQMKPKVVDSATIGHGKSAGWSAVPEASVPEVSSRRTGTAGMDVTAAGASRPEGDPVVPLLKPMDRSDGSGRAINVF